MSEMPQYFNKSSKHLQLEFRESEVTCLKCKPFDMNKEKTQYSVIYLLFGSIEF